MATTRTKSTVGLSPAEAAKVLEARKAARVKRAAAARPELTPEDRVLATFLRDRDHLDGCPGTIDVATARIEAYGSVKPANVAAGIPATPMAVVRCLDCGSMRYREGVEDRESLLDALLAEAAGQDVDDELDATL